MSYRIQKCRTPWCSSQLSIKVGNVNRKLLYCTTCKDEHEKQVLELQYLHNKGIKEILLEEAKLFNFKSLSILSDALESDINSTRLWIKKYFNVCWDEFKRIYKCKDVQCTKYDMINIKNKYYLRKQISSEYICSCLTKDNCLLVKPKGDVAKIFIEELLEKNTN